MDIQDMLSASSRPELRPLTGRSPTPRPPSNHSASPTPVVNYEQDYPLVSHLSHLLNAAVSCLNVYLSFEPLAHKVECGVLQPITGLIDIYRSGMLAQAGILHHLTANIECVLAALRETTLHKRMEFVGSYAALITAASSIPGIVADVPHQSQHGKFALSNSAVSEMSTIEAVARLHSNCDEIVRLCHGDAAEDVAGWRECLKAIKEVMAAREAH